MKFANRRLLLLLLITLIPAVITAAIFTFARAKGIRAEAATELAPISLKVDLSERRLYILESGEVVKSYPVAVGQPSHPTPTGTFRTGRIEWNPSWTPPPREWARGLEPRKPGDPRNPMQGVKIYFREPWYYIHGTNDPASIGTAASRGCIRMRPEDAKELARRIESAGGNVRLQIVA